MEHFILILIRDPVKAFFLHCALACLPLGTSIFARQTNVALGRPVVASGATHPGHPSANLTDGNPATMSHPQAKTGTAGFYYEIDLGKDYTLHELVVYNRSNCCPERLTRYRVSVFASNDARRATPNWSAILRSDGTNSGMGGANRADSTLDSHGNLFGRFIRVINTGGGKYNPQVAELEAWVEQSNEVGVSMNPPHGFYDEPFKLTISALSPGSQIRYTTDSTEPTLSTGQLYAGPVTISGTTTVRAVSFEPGKTGSRVETRSYIFRDEVVESAVMDKGITGHAVYGPKMRDSLVGIPSMVITTGGPINGSTETFGAVELIPTNGETGFQVNAGIRNFGGAFTNFAKKNFRISFRKEFGVSKLSYPLFEGFEHGIEPAAEFDQLNLRTGSHDMEKRGFYMSNRFTDDTMLEMGNINPHGRFVHLFLDGSYWGMYHLRERWSADTLTEYLGGQAEDYESINGNWNVGGWADPGDPYDGDGSAWTRIKTLRGDYEQIRTYLDVPNYIDYMILFMFGNSEAEYRCAGPVGEGSGFKFFLNDADGWLRTTAGNRTGRDAPGRKAGDGPGSIFSMLHKEGHPDYKVLLADRIHKHLFNNGALTPSSNATRLQARIDEMELAFLAESARWNYRSPGSWSIAKDEIFNTWFPTRTTTMISHLKSAGFYPGIDAPILNRHGGPVFAGFELQLSAEAGAVIHHTTDGSDPRLKGGEISSSAIGSAANTASLVINRNTRVKARALLNGEWSALTDTFFWVHHPVAPGDLVISELHYHPRDNAQMEFLELQNVSGQAINLSGARFQTGIRYTFSSTVDTILPASGRFLLARSQFDMQKAHGLGLDIGGVYQGTLSNKGEELSLIDMNGNTLARLQYSDGVPWPDAADGDGPSLVFHGPSSLQNDPSTWRVGQSGGSPGAGEGGHYLANPTLDADGNGHPDLLDYALGQDTNGQTNFPSYNIDLLAGEITAKLRGTYTIWQNPAADDLNFVPEYSINLRDWLPITNQFDIGESKFLDTGILQRYWHNAISETGTATFFRLRIEER